MANGFKLEIKGLDKLQKKIDYLPKDLLAETDGYLQNICKKIQKEAQQKAPNDKGALRQSIEVTGARLAYIITANAKYAPYVEFGTGNLVRVDSRLSGYAAQFKGEGKRQVNLKARPFFFPAVLKQEENIEREYLKLTEKLMNK